MTVEELKAQAQKAQQEAERAWYAYFGACEVGPERTHAAAVYENIRRSLLGERA